MANVHANENNTRYVEPTQTLVVYHKRTERFGVRLFMTIAACANGGSYAARKAMGQTKKKHSTTIVDMQWTGGHQRAHTLTERVLRNVYNGHKCMGCRKWRKNMANKRLFTLTNNNSFIFQSENLFENLLAK